MPATRTTAILLLAAALTLRTDCTTGRRDAAHGTVHGAWRWVGSLGGIVGIRPTPVDEGYELIFFFHRDGRLTVYQGDSTKNRTLYRRARLRAADDTLARPALRYADPLDVFPFDPGIDQQVVKRVGRDTLILADPCCHRYEHAFVRSD